MAHTPFRSEKDVRRWVREHCGRSDRWVEHSSGGTVGLPDTFLVRGGQTLFLELKIGELHGVDLVFETRKEQKKELLRLCSDGALVGMLIGVKGTHDLMLAAVVPGWSMDRLCWALPEVPMWGVNSKVLHKEELPSSWNGKTKGVPEHQKLLGSKFHFFTHFHNSGTREALIN